MIDEKSNEVKRGTFRFGPTIGRHQLTPLEHAALKRLDEAAALLAEAAGMLSAADQDERARRTFPGSGIAGRVVDRIIAAGAEVRECAAKLDGQMEPAR